MGVPKFYRWISERYPCLSEVVRENQIPEFDNLYLDMNGIIHICSHPNDDDPHFRISEEKIFRDIFHYIEVLFRIVKPCKVFFMAVDGVAPRAKMNQQRGRRFRSARVAEEQEKKALQKGETLPTEKRFDSNCITPGTEFMARLHEQLKYFVHKKVTDDKMWQGVRVYLSGHETPGEGEHKIMEFIRSEKAQEDYDPNTRHCLYGLDADLMMLGLTSHEPHFSLLREEVRFGGKKSQKRIPTPEETTFHLLHLSLFREYLEFEFQTLKTKLSFEFDLEHVIDDWVLMGFLVGNDFIPHLPDLHINHDALPLLYRTYIEVLPSLDGYINEGGTLNLKRFEAYLQKLSQFDRDKFSEVSVDLKYFESKKSTSESGAWKGSRLQKKQKEAATAYNISKIPYSALMNEDRQEAAHQDTLGAGDFLVTTVTKDEQEDDEEEIFEIEFRQHKRDYYRTKLGYQDVTGEVLKEQAVIYVTAIQWILHYYYNGVQSWSWFYPHHYAPFMSDVRGFSECTINYSIGQPFKPFQQLLGVLPAASRELLPKPYQSLMIMDNSAIIEYYPVDFKTDLNGKQQDWEAVVLIPFIDEEHLLAAMKPLNNLLTDEEKKRNCHGPHLLYTYDEDLTCDYPSSLPGIFPDINCSHARYEEVKLDAFRIDPKTMRKGLLRGAKEGVYYPGFPTMKHIPHSARLKKCGVKVFQMNSRGENMMLTIEDKSEPDIGRLCRELLGKTVFAGWPHLQEVMVTGVADDEIRYELKESSGRDQAYRGNGEIVGIEQSDREAANWVKEVQSITEHYLNRKGVIIGQTFVVLYAKPLTGRKYVCGANGMITLEKQWTLHPIPYALQICVKDIAAYDPSFTQFKTLEELFPAKSVCFMLGTPHYGCMGEVLEVDRKGEPRVRVAFSIPPEPNLDQIANRQGRLQERYQPGYVLAQRLGISSHLVSRITGTFFILRGSRNDMGTYKVNVGLNLKFNKRNKEVPGFTKKEEDGNWTYSMKSQDVIAQYIQKFPELFDHVAKNAQNDMFYEEDVFGPNSNRSSEITEWLKTLACYNVEQVQSGYKSLDDTVVKAIVQEIEKLKECKQKRKLKMSVKPYLLFRPLNQQGHSMPDSNADYELFDRVINIREGYSVPLGLKGVVVGIITADRPADVLYDVIFDSEFEGAFTKSGSKKGYHLPASAMMNISFGVRKESYQQSGMQKPMAVVKPQSSPEPSSRSPRYYADMVKSAGSADTWRSMNSPRINHSPNSPFIPSQTYNKSKYNNSSPRYHVTPDHKSQSYTNQPNIGKKTLLPTPHQKEGNYQQSPRQPDQELRPKLLKRPSQQDSQVTSVDNVEVNEFANMWKQLQGSPQVPNVTTSPTASTSATLAMAAAALPIRSGQEERERIRQTQVTDFSNEPDVAPLKEESQERHNPGNMDGKDLEYEFSQFLSTLKVSDNTDNSSATIIIDNQTAKLDKTTQDSNDGNERNSPGTIAKMQEGTETLCKLLHIGSPSEDLHVQSSKKESTISYGKPLALSDLFTESGTLSPATPITTPMQSGPSPAVSVTTPVQSGPSLVSPVVNPVQSGPSMVSPVVNPVQSGPSLVSPVVNPMQSGIVQQRAMRTSNVTTVPSPQQNWVLELFHWCQSHRFPLPTYQFQKTAQDSVFSTVFIGSHAFNGLASSNKEQASASAASIAYFSMTKNTAQHQQYSQSPLTLQTKNTAQHQQYNQSPRQYSQPSNQAQQPYPLMTVPVSTPHGGVAIRGTHYPHFQQQMSGQMQCRIGQSSFTPRAAFPNPQLQRNLSPKIQQSQQDPKWQYMSQPAGGAHQLPQQHGLDRKQQIYMQSPHQVFHADTTQHSNLSRSNLQPTANIFVPLQVTRNRTTASKSKVQDETATEDVGDDNKGDTMTSLHFKHNEADDHVRDTCKQDPQHKEYEGHTHASTHKKSVKGKTKAKLAINFSSS
ncbi:5'-3' exoribonuclease 1-like [Glandiceps talaboti]